MSTDLGSATLYVRHIPDAGPDPNHPRPDSVELGAGTLEVGVTVAGVDIPLADLKASDYVQRIQDAQQQQSQQQSQQQTDQQNATAGQPGSGYETPTTS